MAAAVGADGDRVAVHLDEAGAPRGAEGERRGPDAHRAALTKGVQECDDGARAVVGGAGGDDQRALVGDRERQVARQQPAGQRVLEAGAHVQRIARPPAPAHRLRRVAGREQR